jgi:hypothetical protein
MTMNDIYCSTTVGPAFPSVFFCTSLSLSKQQSTISVVAEDSYVKKVKEASPATSIDGWMDKSRAMSAVRPVCLFQIIPG